MKRALLAAAVCCGLVGRLFDARCAESVFSSSGPKMAELQPIEAQR
jgi:hypothetical protein